MNDSPQTDWKAVFDYRCFKPKGRERTMLGSNSRPYKCIFCLRSEPEVKFKKEAHVIPASFGNRTLLSWEECDSCNQRAGNIFEDDLANSLALERALTGTRSRKGSVKLKLRPHLNPASYIEGREGEIYILTTDNDDSVQTTMNAQTSELTIKARTPHFVPANVAKAMARMLYFVAADERNKLRHIWQWLRGEVSWEPLAYFSIFFAGPQEPEFRLQVWQGEEIPFAVQFGNGSFSNVLLIPDSSWVISDSVVLPLLESETPIPPLMHFIVAPTEDADIAKCYRKKLRG